MKAWTGPFGDPLRREVVRVEPVGIRAPEPHVALRGERPDQDDVVLADPVPAEQAVLEAAPDRDRHRRVDPQRLLDHLRRVRQARQVVVAQVVLRVAAGDPVDLGDEPGLDVRARGEDRDQPRGRDRRPVEAVGEVHEDLVAHGLGVEELTGLGVRRADQAAEQVDRLASRARVPVGRARGRPRSRTAPRCGGGRPCGARGRRDRPTGRSRGGGRRRGGCSPSCWPEPPPRTRAAAPSPSSRPKS